MLNIKETYTFGNLTLNTSLHYLKHDRQTRLSPKCTQVFALLAENANNLVDKEQILDTVWPGRFGADESLTRAVSDIRKALKGFRLGAEKAIKTVPKRGYMLNTKVLEEAFSELVEQDIPSSSERTHSHGDAEKQTSSNALRWFNKRIATFSVLCFLMLSLISYWAYFHYAPDQIDSIAVLPFETIGADPELEALAEGLGYEIAMQISFQNHINIASPQAVERLGSRLPLSDIADVVDVSHIITGFVNNAKSEKTISISLVHAGTQKILWTEQHHFDEDHLLDIYESVLTNFRYLGDNEALPVGYASQEALKPSAYANYLRAMQIIRSQAWFEWGEAVPYLNQALDIQPDFHPPMVSLAALHSLSSYFGKDHRSLPEARKLLDQAIDLNASDVDFLNAESLYHLACASNEPDSDDCSFEQALLFIDEAIALAPEYWVPPYVKGLILEEQGKLTKALALYKRSNEIDPMVTGPYLSLGQVYLELNDSDAFEKTRERLYAALSNGTGVFLVGDTALDLFHKRRYFEAYVLASMIESKVAASNIKELKIRIETELDRENSTRQLSELRPIDELGPIYKLFGLAHDSPSKAVDLIMQIDDEVSYRSWLSRQHAEIMLKFASLEQINSNYEKLVNAVKRTKSAREHTFMAYLMKLRNEDNWQQPLDNVFSFELNPSNSEEYD